MPRYGKVDHDYGLRMATCEPDADGPVYMLNLMKYREVADYGEGGETGVSGRDADDRYAPTDVLDEIGARVAFFANVVDSSEDWDRVGVVRYPTRRSFIEMQSRPDFQAKHVHKEAGMDHTIVMGTLPLDGLPAAAGPGRVLLEVWAGTDGAATGAGAAGGESEDAATFAVEGTILGDGRTWSRVRYRSLGEDEEPDVSAGDVGHQLLVLDPRIEQWT
jgi:hypothetical protein